VDGKSFRVKIKEKKPKKKAKKWFGLCFF
jgi:hypothetical protein